MNQVKMLPGFEPRQMSYPKTGTKRQLELQAIRKRLAKCNSERLVSSRLRRFCRVSGVRLNEVAVPPVQIKRPGYRTDLLRTWVILRDSPSAPS